MCAEKSPWQKAVEFHGHACPGLAIGYKAAEAAIKVMGDIRDSDEEIVAIVHNDNCSVDGIQSVLGCTVGKGNLIFCNMGKNVYTIGRRDDGKAVRIALKFNALRDGGTKEERTQQILGANIEDLFNVREVIMNLQGKAQIFKSVQCSRCGEGVMEPKAHINQGKPVCPECFEEYTRGW